MAGSLARVGSEFRVRVNVGDRLRIKVIQGFKLISVGIDQK